MKIREMTAADYGMTETEWAIYLRQNRMGRLIHHKLRDKYKVAYQRLMATDSLETTLKASGQKLAADHLQQKRLVMAKNPPRGADFMSKVRWETMASDLTDEILPEMVEAAVRNEILPMVETPPSPSTPGATG